MSMKICDHFMNDTCRFNDKCKYSHGYRVNLDDIHSYLEPNYEYNDAIILIDYKMCLNTSYFGLIK